MGPWSPPVSLYCFDSEPTSGGIQQQQERQQGQQSQQSKIQNSPASGGPGIIGTLAVGETLAATTYRISDEDGLSKAVFAFQWIRHDPVEQTDADIPGETAQTYTVTSGDEAKGLRLRVTFTDDAGNQESLTSNAFLTAPPVQDPAGASDEPPANSPATGSPTITGTAQVGETLTADTNGISDDDGLADVSYSYQWISNDGTTDTDIQDATASTYTLVVADEGKTIKVQVSFTDDAGNKETLTSAATEAVTQALAAEPTDRPHGLTATASDGAIVLTWQEPDNRSGFDYQIMRHRPELGEPEPLVYVDYTGNSDTTFTDTEVELGVLYVYRVKAVIDIFGYLGEASLPLDIRVPGSEGNSESDPTTPVETNSPATGAPAISGTAEVGRDADGRHLGYRRRGRA